MTRVVFLVASLVTRVVSARATVMVSLARPDPVDATVSTSQRPSARITLATSDRLQILQALFVGPISSLSLIGPGVTISSGMIASLAHAVPAAFADAMDVAAGTYLPSVASAVLDAATFAASEAALPGAVALLGSAVVGLMRCRRRRAPG